MRQETIQRVKDLIESGICEPSRLYHILRTLERNKPLYKSDEAYLERMCKRLEEKIEALRIENKKIEQSLQREYLKQSYWSTLSKKEKKTKQHGPSTNSSKSRNNHSSISKTTLTKPQQWTTPKKTLINEDILNSIIERQNTKVTCEVDIQSSPTGTLQKRIKGIFKK